MSLDEIDKAVRFPLLEAILEALGSLQLFLFLPCLEELFFKESVELRWLEIAPSDRFSLFGGAQSV